MKRWSLVAAWLIVAVLATGLTWRIVSAADARVSDRPVPLEVDAPLAEASSTTTSTVAIPTTTSSTTTLPSSGTGSTVATTAPITSPTTSAPATTSTAAATSWTTKAILTGGGTVVVNYRGDEVLLVAATPAAGFAVEVDKSGPDEVAVEFESDSAQYEVKARSSGGVLDVETDSDTD